jgi:hypothetical protein
MKITKVMVNRKFNLGNYESLDVAAEAELSESDNVLEAWSILRDNAEMWFIDQQRKKEASKPSQEPPHPVAPNPQPKTSASPMQLANEATQKREAAQTGQAKAGQTVENIRKKFPADLADKLDFTEENGAIIIKVKTFLGNEAFREVLDTVTALGGKYVPASNNAHPYFTIPVPEVQQK